VDEENRFDVVEVSGKTCLEVVREHLQAGSQHARCEDLERRLEWALEMGVDELSIIFQVVLHFDPPPKKAWFFFFFF
jgi:hypothetical protein